MRLICYLLLLACAGPLRAQISFVPGHYYTTSDSDLGVQCQITEWDLAGNSVGSLTLPPDIAYYLKGMAFGQDGLLYVSAAPNFSDWRIYAINEKGEVAQTYPLNVYLFGNLSYGKLAVGAGYIFVAGQDVLTRFRIGDPQSATVVYTGNEVFGVKFLPNGNLIVAQIFGIDEITTSGTLVRRFPSNKFALNLRGIAYDAPTNKLFVSFLGYAGLYYQVIRFDYATGLLEANVTSLYADDLLIDEAGNLLVGSRTLPPLMMNRDLVTLETFGTNPQMFVAQCPSPPTPASMEMDAGSAHLRWHDPALRSWRIEYSDDLSAGLWQTYADLSFPDSNGMVDLLDSSLPAKGQRFYRLAPPVLASRPAVGSRVMRATDPIRAEWPNKTSPPFKADARGQVTRANPGNN